MNASDLTLQDWQRLVAEYSAGHKKPYHDTPLAMRTENSQLSIAARFGGIVYNGYNFTYFAPLDLGHFDADGKPVRAGLVVREDLLQWVEQRLKEEAKREKKALKAARDAEPKLF